MKELGIYIHIPFCKRKCKYCDFISFSNKFELVDKYIESIKEEIKNLTLGRDSKITTVYFGGGTPSAIESKYIKEILDEIKSVGKLENTEITIEVNPGTVTKDKLKDYLQMGINRLSIGLQTTSNALLKLIGRIHTYSEFEETYRMARDVGFKNINVDLMIGLPTENLPDVECDLDKIIRLKPEHISVYSLILEEGTELEVKVSKKELYLPSEELERKMYWQVKNRLEEKGYIHYEISNFAKPNFESKHNLNCWNQMEYIGFGLAAHSYINKTRMSNTENLEKYIKTNGENKTIHEKQDVFEEEKEFMLLGLRKIEGVKISDFKNKFGHNPIYVFRNELDKLVKKELIEVEENNIKLTNKGLDLANLVWEEFI